VALSFAAYVDQVADDIERGESLVEGDHITHWRYVKGARAPRRKRPARGR
jgi:hypothetical protein